MSSRRAAGLTLIELAITVAVIAVLCAIAIPSVGWVIAKSKQSEARANLGTVYDLESAYHFENHTYGTLQDVGFVPDGVNRYAYCAGDPKTAGSCLQSATDVFDFASANGGYHNGGSITGPILGCATPPCTPKQKPPVPPTPAPGTIAVCSGNSHVAQDDFEADAYGRISPKPPPHDLDCWLIDGHRSLDNFAVGY